MDFITACSNARAASYRIAPANKHKTKSANAQNLASQAQKDLAAAKKKLKAAKKKLAAEKKKKKKTASSARRNQNDRDGKPNASRNGKKKN